MHVERIHKMQECLTEKAVNELEKGMDVQEAINNIKNES